ncbi:hypothetical protein HCN44_001697 [Aphidius gifuensis]|uniref:tRNA (guanine(37)-N1)-methyltransferase n=2 Tax=Aphidius gifuensis TaxID=684658 RepID=A0A835CQL3_APHGI|nr:hypothetical protein HCN44_001697 [Aphidius gifuensis]
MVKTLAPPDTVKGMTKLNRDAFTSNYEVPCLNLGNVSPQIILPAVKKYLLKLRNYKAVKIVDDNLMITLDPSKVESINDIDKPDLDIIKKYTSCIDKTMLTLKYDNWNAEQIFKAIIPDDIDVPSSYTKVGHIVHLNLRDNQLPFKDIIGQIYLDTTSQTKTVVNKLNNINNEYRNFSMEILAGENNTIATLKENNCQFKFDFSKVYWNSRLSTEHERLLEFMKKNDVLYDVFCGVGPFSIPAAKKGVTVMANDLNPESYKWLMENAKINKIKNNLNCYNKDGRDFLRNDVKNNLLARRKNNEDGNEHIAMNLPALAYEYLDVFHDWLNDDEINLITKKPPLIHLYCFVKVKKEDDPKLAAKKLVESVINCELTDDALKIIHYVRNVAPAKDMMRVSFYLTEKIMKQGEPLKKKAKIDNVDYDISDKHGEKQEADEEKTCQ